MCHYLSMLSISCNARKNGALHSWQWERRVHWNNENHESVTWFMVARTSLRLDGPGWCRKGWSAPRSCFAISSECLWGGVACRPAGAWLMQKGRSVRRWDTCECEAWVTTSGEENLAGELGYPTLSRARSSRKSEQRNAILNCEFI